MSESHEPEMPSPASVSPEQVQEITKHIKKYVTIGICQVFFSFVTVGISFWNFGSTATQVLLTLLTAALNGGVVAAIMMHLKEEKQTIWKFLIFTGVFFFILFFLTYLARTDDIVQTLHNHH